VVLLLFLFLYIFHWSGVVWLFLFLLLYCVRCLTLLKKKKHVYKPIRKAPKLLCVSPSSWPQFFWFAKAIRNLQKQDVPRWKSLCFLAPDVVLPPTIGLQLNQLSAELFFYIVNSHLILFIRKRLFQVAGNTFPLNYLDAITSLCTPKVYWTDMLRNIKLRHWREIRAILSWVA